MRSSVLVLYCVLATTLADAEKGGHSIIEKRGLSISIQSVAPLDGRQLQDSHAGHDHGDGEEDSHAGHDHGDGEEDSHAGHDHGSASATPAAKPWGVALGASIIVLLCTLSGVIFLVPCLTSNLRNSKMFSAATNAFAAGALLACAFYLLLLEAGAMVEVDTRLGEAGVAALWGTCILIGFLTSSFFDLIGSFFLSAPAQTGTAVDLEADKTTETTVIGDSRSRRIRVLIGICLGDFMHNLCDGVFIGTAFMACNATVGWSVTAATVYHELAQEVSDFLVLTDPEQGNLSPLKALALNVLAGLSVVLGTIIVLAQDDVNTFALGLVLAYGGGVYIQIGAAECMPKAYGLATTPMARFVVLLAFVLGATAIALVLFDHQHCTAGGAHAGHNH